MKKKDEKKKKTTKILLEPLKWKNNPKTCKRCKKPMDPKWQKIQSTSLKRSKYSKKPSNE